MSKRRRIQGTFLGLPVIVAGADGPRIVRSAQSGHKPSCKQCREGAIRRVFSAVTHTPEKDATDRVVRFMGAWACLDHYRITNTKAKDAIELPDHLRDAKTDWSLVELFPNRAYRRRAGHLHGV